MSFLTDLIHGNTSNLGHDITETPASLGRNPMQIAELAGAAALPFVAGPALAGLGGATADALGLGAASETAGGALGFAPEATANFPASAFGDLSSGYGTAFDSYTAPSGIPSTGGVGDIAQSYNGANALTPPSMGGTAVPSSTPASTSPNFLDSLVTGAKNSITSNPLGIAAGGAGLAYAISQGQKQLPEQKALNPVAQQQTAQGQQLQGYLTSGTLPPAVQAQVDQATASAKAAKVAEYARMGLPTDSTQNSSLAQELANIDRQALAQVGQLGTNLYQAGTSQVGLGSQIYQNLLATDQQQTANMGKAITSFASALGSGAMAGSKGQTTRQQQGTSATG